MARFFGRVDAASADFMARQAEDDEAPSPAPFTQGVRVEVGIGKSHAAREDIAATLVAMRARGDERSVAMALPMHALSDEQAERFRDLSIVRQSGLRVEVWRGREAMDPAHPDFRHPDPVKAGTATMCGKLDLVRDAQSVELSAQTSCCRRRVKTTDGRRITTTCPLFNTCGYQAQTRRTADLWIMASDLLWHAKPKAMGEIAAVVVDEGAWRKGLQGAEGRHVSLSLDALEEEPRTGDDTALHRLADLRRQVSEALGTQGSRREWL